MYWLNQQGQPTIIDQTLPNWKEIYTTLTWLSFITDEPVEIKQPIVEPVEEVIKPVEEITDETKPVSKKKK